MFRHFEVANGDFCQKPDSEPEMTAPAKSASTVLVIDDDSEIRYSLTRVLSSKGYLVSEAPSGEAGIAAVKKGPAPDVIFLDIRMGGMSGLETLQHIRAINARQLVILMTAFGTAQTAIEAMKFGAFDYIMKPFDPAKVLAIAENALKAHADLRSAGEYKPKLNSEDYKEGIVGSSEPMQEVFKMIGQVTASDVTVMITGESGTGKELVARSIYKHSHRASKPFIAVNCAAIPDNLIESELFGHEKGSFTGATGQRIGKFELCDGGTIFLDEIGDMALATQTKILRVLQEGEIQRVGGTETIKVDVRILAATNKDLEEMVKAKTFREDLYYRLNVVRLRLPPCYRWPGNVRELENVVYRSAVVAQGDAILIKDLPQEIRETVGALAPAAPISTSPSVSPATPESVVRAPAVTEPAAAKAEPKHAAPTLSIDAALDLVYAKLKDADEPILKRVEREMIQRVLHDTEGNLLKASEKLGMTRVTLRKRIEELGLKE